MLLVDQWYQDESGKSVPANEIKSLATYKYAIDGFFTWECPCGQQHNSRAHRVSGVVFTCPTCKKPSLLVRTDFQYVNGIITSVEGNKQPHEERIRKAISKIGEALSALTDSR